MPVLDELVRVCTSPRDSVVTTIEDKVARVLDAKKELDREAKREAKELSKKTTVETRCQTPAPSEPSTEPPLTPLPPPPPSISETPPPPSTKVVKPTFRVTHELNIVAFNSLKLRLDREELQDDWDAAILEFSKYDVLMLSEVRASDKLFRARVHRLVEMLNDCTEEEWTFHHSEPSGPGAKEIHLVVAKRPVNIMAVHTLVELDGQAMDHAPMVAALEDPRFIGELRRVNVVSVHMPPKGTKERRAARDIQIRKLAATYANEASARIGAPFTNQAAKETRKKAPYVAHIIGGDFNADAKELREFEVEKHGWEVVLGNVRTSSGGKSYDNWLINRDCKDHLVIGADVLDLCQFANFSRGQQGISDHAPIALRIKEIPRVVNPVFSSPRKTRSQSGSNEPLW